MSRFPFRISRGLLALMAATVCGAAAANETYAEAKASGQRDATDPAYRQWYVERMRPAFRSALGRLLEGCVRIVPPESLSGFGLVVVIDATGRVTRSYWKSQNMLADCLEPRLRLSRFPEAPKEEFYFGLEAELGGNT